MPTMNGIDIDLTVEQVRNMNGPQLRAEAKSRWDAADVIDSRHGGIVTPDKGEDYAQQRKLLAEADLIGTRIQEVEDAEGRSRLTKANRRQSSEPAERHQQPTGGDSKSIVTMFGEQFVNDPQYKAVLDSGVLNSPSSQTPMSVQMKGDFLGYLCHKALVYSGTGVGGPLIEPQRLPGSLDILNRQLNLLDLIPTSPTTSNLISYVQEKTNTNNAATVAEATATTGTTGLKPESAFEWEPKSSAVTTIAEWTAVTNQFMADVPAVQNMIETRLIYHLSQKLEDQVLAGGGTGSDLLGILGSGIQTLGVAAGATYGGVASVVDAAYAAMLQVQVTGLARPQAFVFNPIDWAAIRLSRENAATGTLGGYQYGSPAMAGASTLWGLPVVLSMGMTQNTMLVGDFTLGCKLYDREQAAIRIGTAGDDFLRNMQRILAELRAAFIVFRTSAFCRVTGV